MKGDNTRFTFEKKKHYSSVRMQQGRVQLDADWNEQVEIAVHRGETETVDSVGHCGAPMHHGGFHLVTGAGDLTEEEQGFQENQNIPDLPEGDFYISGGRYYADGVLCENENIVPFTKQADVPLESLPKDFPNLEEILKEISAPKENGAYLAYLDVWTRHITALEDPEIREVALGGPDTTSRTKTIWQVKLLQVGDENADVDCLSDLSEWSILVLSPDGKLAAKAEESEEEDKPCNLAPGAGYRRPENQLYRVEVHSGGELGEATFKWSRDNGSIVSKWENQDTNDLTVSSTGRDKVLNFAGGQWVELTDDARELLGQPGTMVKLVKVDGQVLTIDPATASGSVNLSSFPKNPKVRRWDSDGEIEPINSDWIDLESGVQVQFANGSYKTGDYWLIPARTATADVEWPIDDTTNEPELQAPHGIRHDYCRLALLRFDGTQLSVISDCRNIFPPLTELTSLLYVSGDGQEAMPGNKLDWPLQVRVVNGQHPVEGVKIQFAIEEGGGTLSVSTPVDSSPDGIAECEWTLGINGKQQVKAVLLDAADQPVAGQILRFNADLSIAIEVAYNPANCTIMRNGTPAENVQDAIDRLCQQQGPEPGIKIEEILRYSENEPVPLMIDDDVPVKDFRNGLFIVCDAPIDPSAVNGRAIGAVSIELPYPLNKADREVWEWDSLTMVGFESIIIAGEFFTSGDPKKEERENHAIAWKPVDSATTWLESMFSVLNIKLEMPIDKLLIRLVLNGNLIWGQKDPGFYLDADLFAIPVKEGPITPNYRSGDDRRGGILNMRFYILNK